MNEYHDTKAALLAEARRLFAERGYRGTSIKAITLGAGANLGAVTYHFGTKERLYHEILQALTGPLLQHMEGATQRSGSALDRLEAGIRTYFSYMHDHLELPSLMLHELSLSGQLPPPIHVTVSAILALMGGLIRAGQEAGEIIAGDARLLTISAMSQPLFFLVMRRPLREVAGIDTREPATRARTLEHLLAFVRRGLTGTGV